MKVSGAASSANDIGRTFILVLLLATLPEAACSVIVEHQLKGLAGRDGDADSDESTWDTAEDDAAPDGVDAMDEVDRENIECQCTGAEDCTDNDPCNGEERCDEYECRCIEGDPLEDGAECGEDPRMICLGGACGESSCGDGFVDTGSGESCDPPNGIDCRSDCVYLGEPCDGSEECDTGFCIDGVCCDSPCEDEVCQRCDFHSVHGAGRCGFTSSPMEDPDDECSTAAPPGPGSCRSEYCSGTAYSCGYLPEGEQGQPACMRCSGDSEDPVRFADFSQDIEGSSLCNDTCMMCNGGQCMAQRAGQDLFNQCDILHCCDGIEGCLVEDSCCSGWQSIYLDSQICADCTDDWCWSRGYCRMRECPYLEEFSPPGYYCQCTQRSSCIP